MITLKWTEKRINNLSRVGAHYCFKHCQVQTN